MIKHIISNVSDKFRSIEHNLFGTVMGSKYFYETITEHPRFPILKVSFSTDHNSTPDPKRCVNRLVSIELGSGHIKVFDPPLLAKSVLNIGGVKCPPPETNFGLWPKIRKSARLRREKFQKMSSFLSVFPFRNRI